MKKMLSLTSTFKISKKIIFKKKNLKEVSNIHFKLIARFNGEKRRETEEKQFY